MQHMLLLVIVALVLGLSYTVIKWPGGMHMTFSQHVAVGRWSVICYAVLFLVTLPFLAWFIGGWLVPQRGLPDVFLWFSYVAIIFQLVCTWVPEVGGVMTIVHRVLTGISGAAIMVLVALIAMATNLSALVRISAGLALGCMLFLLAIALTHQKGYKWALLLQASYYAVFFVTLLEVTYF